MFLSIEIQRIPQLQQITIMARVSPNIIVTGTPGVGKTSHAEMLAEKTGLKHLAINKIAEENNCYDGRDEDLQTWIVDEDKVSDRF
jgi:adenylate kinase